ncbi:hypothetical protein QTO34_002232 [Cnephaeus nilssonii]|uniref:Uncharacterized protein n=1 Tax=Cnephaeus nilssonii TaxID=3371016 RepID=A0AA40HUG3_CNENI|nr:hypothetical protein QTO34_002232 [Eptesicus nilssonii]
MVSSAASVTPSFGVLSFAHCSVPANSHEVALFPVVETEPWEEAFQVMGTVVEGVWHHLSSEGTVRLSNPVFLFLALKELPCSALAPSLESCFSRPERPANRRPPSRWAPHSPTASTAPSLGDPASLEEFGEEEPPGEKLHQ